MNRQSSAAPSKRIEVVSDGKAVAFNPALLTRVQAALYCAFSVGLLDKLRASDAARRMRGEPIQGPAWVRTHFGIRYRPADLDAYLARTSEPCGVMVSRRHPKKKDKK
jgi:hypothetical protein